MREFISPKRLFPARFSTVSTDPASPADTACTGERLPLKEKGISSLSTKEFWEQLVNKKSPMGPSLGNNFNTLTDEAIGSATDSRVAYRAGRFITHMFKPWLG